MAFNSDFQVAEECCTARADMPMECQWKTMVVHYMQGNMDPPEAINSCMCCSMSAHVTSVHMSTQHAHACRDVHAYMHMHACMHVFIRRGGPPSPPPHFLVAVSTPDTGTHAAFSCISMPQHLHMTCSNFWQVSAVAINSITVYKSPLTGSKELECQLKSLWQTASS